jgi:hypothetical protein
MMMAGHVLALYVKGIEFEIVEPPGFGNWSVMDDRG